MSSKKVVIDLFYDVISPYSWVSFEALIRYRQVWPIDVRFRPFLLGGVMRSTENRPPQLFCPAKGQYLEKDYEMNNRYWGMNLIKPKNFIELITTRNTVRPMRMLAAIQLIEPEMLESASREFWTRLWNRGESVYEQEDFEKVALAVGLKDREKVFSLMNSPEVKQIVFKNGEEAIKSGAFGAPWTIVTLPEGTKECFFGADRMHFIAEVIGQPFLGPLKERAFKL